MSDLIAAIGLVFVIEGLLWAMFPGAALQIMAQAANAPETRLRTMGAVAVAIGVFIVWTVRGG